MIVLFTGIIKRVVSTVAPEVCTTSTITHKCVVAVMQHYSVFVTRYEWQYSLIHKLRLPSTVRLVCD